MTSTTYSENSLKQGLSLILWNIKSNITVLVIYAAILCFFSVTNFTGGFAIGMLDNDSEYWKTAAYSMASTAASMSFVFMFVMSIKEFSYLHDKRKTDMFGAMPVTRRTLFFSKMISSFLISAVPMTVVMLALMIITGNSPITEDVGFFTDNITMGTVLYRMLIALAANISFIGFLSVCCGKTSDKIVSYVVINGAFPISALFVQLLPGSFLLGYTINVSNITFVLCPALAAITINWWYWLIFTAVFAGLSFLLVKNRKAESAQSHFAFMAPQIIIKLLVSFAVGIATAYLFVVIFEDTSIEYLRFWFGMILGSFISFLIIQLIFAKGFSKFGKSLIPYGIMIAAFAVVFAVLASGFFGYNSHVPSVNKVRSVSFTEGYDIQVGNENIVEHNITEKEEIERVIKLHQEIYEAVKKDASYSMRDNTLSAIQSMFKSFEGNTYYSFTMGNYGDQREFIDITYTLNNGVKLHRFYGSVDTSKLSAESRDAFYKGASPLFICDDKNLVCSYIYSTSYYEIEDGEIDEDSFSEEALNELKILDEADAYVEYNDEYFNSSKEKRAALAQALRNDFEKYGMNGKYSGIELNLSYGMGNEYSYYDHSHAEVYFYIPENFKETLEMIEKSKQTEN